LLLYTLLTWLVIFTKLKKHNKKLCFFSFYFPIGVGTECNSALSP
jgi:hypothetical protein